MGNMKAAITEPSNLNKRRANAKACLRTQGALVKSQARGKDQEFVKAKDGPHQWPTASGVSTQDDYVQRWLAHTMHELDVTSNVGLGSFKGIGRSALVISLNVFFCFVNCSADFLDT